MVAVPLLESVCLGWVLLSFFRCLEDRFEVKTEILLSKIPLRNAFISVACQFPLINSQTIAQRSELLNRIVQSLCCFQIFGLSKRQLFSPCGSNFPNTLSDKWCFQSTGLCKAFYQFIAQSETFLPSNGDPKHRRFLLLSRRYLNELWMKPSWQLSGSMVSDSSNRTNTNRRCQTVTPNR